MDRPRPLSSTSSGLSDNHVLWVLGRHGLQLPLGDESSLGINNYFGFGYALSESPSLPDLVHNPACVSRNLMKKMLLMPTLF